jgi:hypothetical protein
LEEMEEVITIQITMPIPISIPTIITMPTKT